MASSSPQEEDNHDVIIPVDMITPKSTMASSSPQEEDNHDVIIPVEDMITPKSTMASSSPQEEDNHDVIIPVKVINTEELARDMEEEIERCAKGLRSNPARSTCCIYKVPLSWFKKNDDSKYRLRSVSIGPYYYYDNKELNGDYKYHCLGYFLSRTRAKGIGLEEYMKKLQPREGQARACYSGKIDLDSGEFLEMMVVDASFILELFYELQYPGRLKSNHPLAPLKLSLPNFYEDLLLLENQIPFFVLQELFDISKSPDDPSLYLLALRFFNNIMRRPKAFIKSYAKDLEKRERRPLHLLDLVRSSLIPKSQPDNYDPTCWEIVVCLLALICTLIGVFFHCMACAQWICKKFWGDCCDFAEYDSDKEDPQVQFIPCISKLRRSGIRVQLDEEERLLAVKFENGVIKMPSITMNDFMMSLLRNCLAFEQFHESSSKHVTVYATFLDCLVNTTEDVQYLRDCNVIDNSPLEDDNVAQFINSFCKGLNFGKSDFYLSELFNDVSKYNEMPFNKQRASFKHKYLNSPWSCISVLAGAVLLLLTITQTVFTILAYAHPQK